MKLRETLEKIFRIEGQAKTTETCKSCNVSHKGKLEERDFLTTSHFHEKTLQTRRK